MAMTVEQYWEILQNKIRKFVLRILREEGVYNELMWLDGKIDVVAADGKTADVFINGATTSTKAIPVVNGLTVKAGEEVIILNRSKMRDLVILYGKKSSSTGYTSQFAPSGYGLGTVATVATGDWNNYKNSGFYNADNGSISNGPPVSTGANGWHYVLVTSHTYDPTNWVMQQAWDFNGIDYYIRFKANGTWGAWKKVTMT